MNHQIKPLTPEHSAAVAELHYQTWQVAYAPIYGVEVLQELPAVDFLMLWQERLRKDYYRGWGLWEQERLIGFAGWGSTDAYTAEIYHLYLHADYWGSGYAAELMQHLLGDVKAEHYQEVVLWVLKQNERAQKFYRNWDFKPAGIEKDRYKYGLKLQEVFYKKTL